MVRKITRWISAGIVALIALLATALAGCKAVEKPQQEPVPQQTLPAQEQQDEQNPEGTEPLQEATDPTQEEEQTEPEATQEVTEQTTTTTQEDDAYWETIDIEDIPNPSIPDMTDLG